MRLIRRTSISVLVGSVLLSGCAAPLSNTVTAQPDRCEVHYRDLTQRWAPADFRCAETRLKLPTPRVRSLLATPVDTPLPANGGLHGVR